MPILLHLKINVGFSSGNQREGKNGHQTHGINSGKEQATVVLPAMHNNGIRINDARQRCSTQDVNQLQHIFRIWQFAAG